MHITDTRIDNEWTALTDLIGGPVEADKTYTIISTSPDRIYGVEAAGAPAENVIGAFIEEGQYFLYKKGDQELYLRNGGAYEGKLSNITINVEG